MLIVEDGTGVLNADSYNSVAEHVAYVALYGITVTSEQAEINLRKAMDDIETRRYKGDKEFATTINYLQFPRKEVVIDCVAVSSEDTLRLIKKAQNEIAMSIKQGIDPLAIQKRVVKSESFGPFSRTYMDGKSDTASNPRIDLFLNPLLLDYTGGFSFKVTTHTHYGDY